MKKEKLEKFLNDFIDYFNTNIKSENRMISEDYNLEKMKFNIFLKKELDQSEIERAYQYIITELLTQKLSLDYITPEMVHLSYNEKEGTLLLSLKGILARKPLTNKTQEFSSPEDLEKYKKKIVEEFNKKNKLHKNKVNTYDSFEISLTHGELTDLDIVYSAIKEEAKTLNYKIYQLYPHLLEIETITSNKQYILRYNYGE